MKSKKIRKYYTSSDSDSSSSDRRPKRKAKKKKARVVSDSGSGSDIFKMDDAPSVQKKKTVEKDTSKLSYVDMLLQGI